MPTPNERDRPREGIQLGSVKLKAFFTKHLNIIYAVKAHVLQRLPGLAKEVHFNDLYQAIGETVADIEKQMARMEVIFELLDVSVKPDLGQAKTSQIDDAFDSIKEYDTEPALQDLAILFYLQNIESIEMGSFQILQMAAVKMKNPQVSQLIKENYDEAKADRTLILLIASKYLTAKE